MVAKGKRVVRGMEWEFGAGRYKLLYMEWINSKVPLNSTGNHIQNPEINHNGNEYIRIYFAVQQKLTQYYKSTLL